MNGQLGMSDRLVMNIKTTMQQGLIDLGEMLE